MFWMLNSVRGEICYIKGSPGEKGFHVSKEVADKLQRKYIIKNKVLNKTFLYSTSV